MCKFSRPLSAIRSDRSDLVKLLLLRGANVNQEGCHGRRPLHEASRLGKGALVTMLLEARAQPDPRSHYGLTPLALAAQGGHVEVVETLLKRGEGDRDVAADDNILTTEQPSRWFFFRDTEALIIYFIFSQWFKT